MGSALRNMVARMLQQTAEDIKEGRFSLDDDEILEISSFLTRRKLNIEQICQQFGISRATLNRWQQEGKLPRFRKDSGGKCYLWLDECRTAVLAWERSNRASQ